MSSAFEEAYRKLVTELGFPAPKFEEGETKYHIYIADLLHCGYTSVLEEDCDPYSLLGFMMPVGRTYPFAFFIFMDHDYDIPGWSDAYKWQQAKSTASHEFFHAIQFGRKAGRTLGALSGSSKGRLFGRRMRCSTTSTPT